MGLSTFIYTEGTLNNVPVAPTSTTTVSAAAPLKQPESDSEGHVVNEKPSDDITDIDLSDPELKKAASTIQARFRSHLKKEESKKNQEETEPVVADQSEVLNQAPDVLPALDLSDPELNKAASVIQTNFRTYLSEKNKTGENQEETKGTGTGGEPDPTTSPAELTKAESKETTSVEMEESNKKDEGPTELEEEPKSKEDVAESDFDPLPESVKQERDTEDVSTSTCG